MKRQKLKFEIPPGNCNLKVPGPDVPPRSSPLEHGALEGESPVQRRAASLRSDSDESSCLGMQLKVGGKFHLKLNIGERPIANKYSDGKMKSTLKRE